MTQNIPYIGVISSALTEFLKIQDVRTVVSVVQFRALQTLQACREPSCLHAPRVRCMLQERPPVSDLYKKAIKKQAVIESPRESSTALTRNIASEDTIPLTIRVQKWTRTHPSPFVNDCVTIQQTHSCVYLCEAQVEGL